MNDRTEDRKIEFQDNMPDTMHGCVLTIGNFDGVHMGHRRLLEKARDLADEIGSSVVAMNFDPPPDLVIRPKKFPERISPQAEKISLLLEAGADYAVTVPANEKLLAMSPEQFVDAIVMRNFAPKHIVEGPNFHFGSKRAGTIDSLRTMGLDLGFDVHIVSCLYLELDGESTRVCSTLIRQLVKSGRVSDAANLLTRPFALTGTIVQGEGIGRQLDYPTANIIPEQQVIPLEGVYAARATIDGVGMTTAVSIGTRPTFDGGGQTVEAYLLGTVDDLYGKIMTLQFLKRIRDQIKFSDAEHLKQQISSDIRQIREIEDIE